MSETAEFNRLIGQRIKELIPVQTFWAICKSVDWEKKTMTAIGQIDELEDDQVSLGSGSIYRKPSVNTICLLGIIENGVNAFLIDAVEIEEYLLVDKTGFKVCLNDLGLTLNGDTLGGIVKAKELKTQVDKNTEILNQIQTVFNSWIAVPQDGGAALKALSNAFTGLPLSDLSNIENEKIKHG